MLEMRVGWIEWDCCENKGVNVFFDECIYKLNDKFK